MVLGTPARTAGPCRKWQRCLGAWHLWPHQQARATGMQHVDMREYERHAHARRCDGGRSTRKTRSPPWRSTAFSQ